jgi:hypothetical protein
MEHTKVCLGCKENKSIFEYYFSAKALDGCVAYCKPCSHKQVQLWRNKNPEKRRAVDRKKAYGITEKQWYALFMKQGQVCAICGTDTPGGPKKQWHTDHDHKTKEVRGILCNKCNIGLGSFKDDVVALRAAIIYLTSWVN